MARFIPLDTGVLGLLYSSPQLPQVAACTAWLARMDAAGNVVVIPDVTLYEARRELVRLDATAKLRRLDRLRDAIAPARVTPEAWLKASEFWALVRRAGIPTDHPEALDGDAILAAVAVTLVGPGDTATIATTNVGHLARFPGVDARPWDQIAP